MRPCTLQDCLALLWSKKTSVREMLILGWDYISALSSVVGTVSNRYYQVKLCGFAVPDRRGIADV